MNLSISDIIMLILLIVSVMLLAFILFRQGEFIRRQREDGPGKKLDALSSDLEELRHDINETVPSRVGDIRLDIDRRLRQDAEENRQNRIEINASLERSSEKQDQALERFQEKIDERLRASLSELSQSNREKLSEIQ